MQLKGLVRFFAIALIVICVYQLSFTWFVRNHENDMDAKAEKWLKAANYPTPEQKYGNNAEAKALYEDTLKQIRATRLRRLLDSTKETKIGLFGLTTYQNAKDKELMLGLDLQGGMSVTMEVGLDGLIKSLANYSKDPQFTKALDAAVKLKANSGTDLVTLFTNEYKKVNPAGKLAPFFATKSNGKIKFDADDAKVITYLREQSDVAFENTYRILRTRIDKFGVSSPNINKNPNKGIITIELAGVNDPERVRKYLQSTANLQFFEVYTVESEDLRKGLENADKSLQDYFNGVKATEKDTTAKKIEPTKSTTASVDSNKTRKISDVDSNVSTNKADTSKNKINANPISKLFQMGGEHQPSKGANNATSYPAALAYIATKDTGLFNQYMAMDIVKNKFPSTLVFMFGKAQDEKGRPANNKLNLYAVKTLENGQAKLEGEHVTEARQDYEGSKVVIRMNMDKEGTKLWGDLTSKNVGKPVAVVLDNFVYSAPNVIDAITTGSTQISGNYSIKEAQDLSEILQTGKLPAPAKIVQEQVIGPTIGDEAAKGGLMSFLVAFIVIFALMLLYYNTAGWVANIALILNILFTVGILASWGFTLTAAGIAGLVLTIGMAVDTNVIIFERIKEELTKGKSYKSAVDDGYKRSLAPILDAHVTSFLTAGILFYFGLGPVLGFATTQMLGITLSLFCGILVSRLITDIYANKNGRHFEYFTSLSRKIFKHASFKFIEYRKYAYGISVVVLLLGVASFFNGFDEGVEFAGGRSYTIRFDKPVSPDAIRDDLKKAFGGETPIIKTIGSNNQLDITTSYKIRETGNKIDSAVEQTLYSGLKNHLPKDLSYVEFDKNYKQSSQTVLPTISDELKSGAIKAAIFAMLIICLYIFIRFRDWRYSLGTIVALLHDVLVTLAVFSFLRSVVPFPLEIDQHFIAAVLTVIGFSMNDTVIVYDRIREDSKLYPTMPKEQIINTAINQTLSRTIMTSLTVFLTILILFIFGGEVTRGFSFAMLIGVITGTYSSIFVAAPILVDFAKSRPLGKPAIKKA